MFQQREKLRQISLITLILAIFFGLVSILKVHAFAYLTLYMISFSIISEGLLLNITYRNGKGTRFLLLGCLLLIITTLVFAHFLRYN